MFSLYADLIQFAERSPSGGLFVGLRSFTQPTGHLVFLN